MQTPARSPAGVDIASELSGALPCVVCKYNLQGASVLGVCSECGTPVRATILAIVDPKAAELRPVPFPLVTAIGVLLWVLGAAVAMTLCWPMIAGALAGLWADDSILVPPLWLPTWVMVALIASAIGSTALWRPHRGVTWPMTLGSVLSTGVIVGVAIGARYHMHMIRPSSVRAISDLWIDPESQVVPRVSLALGVGLVLMLSRPVLRLLVARCLAIRTGRVDRQTVSAMVAAMAASVIGDGLGLAGALWGGAGAMKDTMQSIGFVMMLGGLALFSLGLIGACVDAVRIARALLAPSPSVEQVFGTAEESPASRSIARSESGMGGEGER